MYEYRCQVFNVVDGDTVDCVLDLGRRVNVTDRVRLWGINVRDRDNPNALTAQSFLRFLVIGKPLIIRTIKDKDDKYGRLLGVFFEHGSDVSVNQKILDQGYAAPYLVTLTPSGRLPEVRDGHVVKEL